MAPFSGGTAIFDGETGVPLAAVPWDRGAKGIRCWEGRRRLSPMPFAAGMVSRLKQLGERVFRRPFAKAITEVPVQAVIITMFPYLACIQPSAYLIERLVVERGGRFG